MDKTFKDACFIVNLRSPYFKGSFFLVNSAIKKRQSMKPVKVLNSFNRLNRTLIWGTFRKKID